MKSRAFILLGLFLPPSAFAGTLHVPADYPTIADALAAASAGNLVEIACGTYPEHDLVLKTGVVVTSTTGQSECVTIDAQRAGRGFVADGVAGCDLVGVTVRNALPAGAGASGGGLYCINSTVSLGHVRFVNCAAEGNGGAFYAENSLVTIDACEFDSNVAGGRGGALAGAGAETHLIDCEFNHNSASVHGAVSLVDAPFGVFEACIFVGNEADSAGAFGAHDSVAGLFGCTLAANRALAGGGAMITGSSSLRFLGCRIHGNDANVGAAIAIGPGAELELLRGVLFSNAAQAGGAIRVDDGTLTATRSTFAGNGAGSGAHLSVEGHSAGVEVSQCIFTGGIQAEPVACGNGATLTVACTDVWGNALGDWVGCLAAWEGTDANLSADPLFCDPDAGDYSIRSDSPCTSASSGCGLFGAIDVGCEPTAVRAETWSGIKSRYR